MRTPCKRTTYLLYGALALSVSACNSQQSETTKDTPEVSAPAAPSITLTPTAIKTLRFSWTDVSGETEYRLLEDADGASGYSQIATISADSSNYDHTVLLPARVNARYILQACNDGGCSDSSQVNVGDTLAAIGYFKASNAETTDAFGYALALSGDGQTLAVSATAERSSASGINGDEANNSAAGSGAVYVFYRGNSGWTQQAYVKASNTDIGDTFGRALALSSDGNTLAVGANGERSNATGINNDQSNNSLGNSGAVYVFSRNGSSWSQQAYIKASNSGASDAFGLALSLAADGNTLSVGAPGEGSNATGINNDQANNSMGFSGAAYIFTRSGSSWSQQAYIKASNTEAGDQFGYTVALAADGQTLAVGASKERSNATGIGDNQADNSAISSGAVYVFARSGSNWSQQAYVKASNTDADDEFGAALALSADGNLLAVGARLEDSNAIGINGDQNDDSAVNSGAVYLFTRSGSSWSQQAYLKASNAAGSDQFGNAIALAADGNTLLVAASAETNSATGINNEEPPPNLASAGAAYTFTYDGNNWSQQAFIKASNTGLSDNFGFAAAIDSDAQTIAIGAPGEKSSASGIGGIQSDDSASASGAAYLY